MADALLCLAQLQAIGVAARRGIRSVETLAAALHARAHRRALARAAMFGAPAGGGLFGAGGGLGLNLGLGGGVAIIVAGPIENAQRSGAEPLEHIPSTGARGLDVGWRTAPSFGAGGSSWTRLRLLGSDSCVDLGVPGKLGGQLAQRIRDISAKAGARTQLILSPSLASACRRRMLDLPPQAGGEP